jgi:hypothetical protein
MDDLADQMSMTLGFGGWCRIVGDDLPGPLFLRFRQDAHGRLSVRDFYLQADWRPLISGDMRERDLGRLTAVATSALDHLSEHRRRQFFESPGPDLATLADSFDTWPPAAVPEACECCGSPVVWAYDEPRPLDWVAQSRMAGKHDVVPSPPKHRRKGKAKAAVPSGAALTPQEGYVELTDDFLRQVADAYLAARARSGRPAVALAQQAKREVNTVRRWIRIARERGFLPPGRPSSGGE